MHEAPTVLILMASRDGARWLPAQLASIAAQTCTDWALWVADDGSRDQTRRILADFAAERAGRNAVRLVEGPRAGSAGANFLSLLARDDLPLGPATHVAFADQDDLWYPGKLGRALAQLAGATGPALYGAQSRHVDAAGRPTGGLSRRPRQAVVLGNALVQNLVSGHSAVLNPEGAALAQSLGAPPGVVFHDWWLSQLLLACGGALRIDGETVLDYRQHGTKGGGGNALGAPVGMGAAAARLGMLRRSMYRDWIAANLAGLARAPLTPAARAVVAALRAAPAAGPGRLAAFRRLGLHRQSRAGTLALWLAALAGRA